MLLRVTFYSITFLFLFQVTTIAEEKFGGIGLIVAQLFDPSTTSKAGELVVIDVLAETDAQKQGVQRGDVITEIDQKNTKGADFAALITKSLRGEIGSETVLKVKRSGVKELLTFKIKRVEITPP